jgi:hypothetical protein
VITLYPLLRFVMERTQGHISHFRASGHAPQPPGRKPAHIRLAAPVLLARCGRFLWRVENSRVGSPEEVSQLPGYPEPKTKAR